MESLTWERLGASLLGLGEGLDQDGAVAAPGSGTPQKTRDLLGFSSHRAAELVWNAGNSSGLAVPGAEPHRVPSELMAGSGEPLGGVGP